MKLKQNRTRGIYLPVDPYNKIVDLAHYNIRPPTFAWVITHTRIFHLTQSMVDLI